MEAKKAQQSLESTYKQLDSVSPLLGFWKTERFSQLHFPSVLDELQHFRFTISRTCFCILYVGLIRKVVIFEREWLQKQCGQSDDYICP